MAVRREADRPSCEVWGILNVTPDSFSDGGRFLDAAAAVAHGARLLAQGASVIDIGGESARPAGRVYGAGAQPVSEEEETRRVLPVVTRLAAEARERGARLSIDTVKPEVARRALEAGVEIVNDVSCGTDARLLGVVGRAGAELVLMHNRGRGETDGPGVVYRDLMADVSAELLAAVERACTAGVDRAKIWIDPGLGFAKTEDQSTELLARVGELAGLGLPVLVGPSRKAFLGSAAKLPTGERPAPHERLGGTCAAAWMAARAGARAVRVHDVAQVRQALLVVAAVERHRSKSRGAEATA